MRPVEELDKLRILAIHILSNSTSEMPRGNSHATAQDRLISNHDDFTNEWNELMRVICTGAGPAITIPCRGR